jgi:hypothetical protein
MKRIGLIGENTYENKLKIKNILFQLKQKHGTDIEIVSRGTLQGAEKYVKKYALDLGLQYREFNPAHTTHNLYSALNEGFYNKPYKPFNFILRDKMFVSYVDVCICLVEENSSAKNLKTCIVLLEKSEKKYVIMN